MSWFRRLICAGSRELDRYGDGWAEGAGAYCAGAAGAGVAGVVAVGGGAEPSNHPNA